MSDSIGKLGNYTRSFIIEGVGFRVRIEMDAVDDQALTQAQQWARAALKKEDDDATE